MIPRKVIIIGSILFILAVIGIGILFYVKDYKQVTFSANYDTDIILSNPTDSTNKTIATIKNNTSTWLKKQEYKVSYSNSSLAPETTAVKVDDSTSKITLTPNLTSTALNSLLQPQQATIDAKIKSAITSTSAYVLTTGNLYHRGEWYGTTIQVYHVASTDPDISNPGDVDTYYIVLKKNGNDWSVAAGPSLILTKPANPSVPSDIIDALNPTS